MGEVNSSLDQNGSGPAVYVAHGRALGTHFFWCCGQHDVGVSKRVATTGTGGRVTGLFPHCLSRQ